MKLYVWNDPYHIDYGGTCLYVIAESEEQARELAPSAGVSQYGHEPGGGPPQKMELGVPRVHDLPHAEIYHWSE